MLMEEHFEVFTRNILRFDLQHKNAFYFSEDESV